MNPEYIKLAQIAYDTVLATMLEGEVTHPGNEWKDVAADDHTQHAADHIENALVAMEYNWVQSEDHIGHALTRLAMIKAKEQEK